MRIPLLIIIVFCAPARAQIETTGPWSIDEVRSFCIPLEEPEDVTGPRVCIVNEFKELITLNGHSVYYALYTDFPPENESPELGVDNNVLVIFQGDAGSDKVTLVREHSDGRFWGQHYNEPEVIHTAEGVVLYLDGWGIGDSRSMFSYDDYWLWTEGMWAQLDVWSWYNDQTYREFLPESFGLAGVLKTDFRADFDLPVTRHVAPVTRYQDCHSCSPTGGTAIVELELDQQTLRLKRLIHEPEEQFLFQ